MESILGLVCHPGNAGLFRALEMSVLATLSGQPFHVHAEGLRGTGKTTLMRAAQRVLPTIRRIRGCLYNCDPLRPHCPHHRMLAAAELEELGTEWVPMPFLEISHSAKVGTVVGTIDLGRLVHPTQPEAALLPGTIPQAHRGILFIDEINRLAETSPELADVLLDVMGTKPGRIQIEESGLPPTKMAVQVSVWAASNPDEEPGPLEEVRRQLSDRFDIAVYTDRPSDPAVVEQILAASEFERAHIARTPLQQSSIDLYRTRLAARAAALFSVSIPAAMRRDIAELYSKFGLESLRAVQAIQMAIRLSACLSGSAEPAASELARLAPLALRHRVDADTMKKITAHLAGRDLRSDTAASRGLLPALGLSGAAAQPHPAPPSQEAVRAAAGSRELAPAQAPAPRPAALEAPEEKGWLGRTLDGFRRNLRRGLSEGQTPLSQLSPRPGRLFQEAGQQPVNPLNVPFTAPHAAARPISQLDPREYIRTQEELDRR